MKQGLLMLAVMGILFSGCKKDEMVSPETGAIILKVPQKGILCRGCGAGWDLSSSDSTTLRAESNSPSTTGYPADREFPKPKRP